MFGLSLGMRIFRFHRIRYANDLPIAIKHSTIVVSGLPSIHMVKDSLYNALRNAGNRPFRALQRLRATLFDPEQAAPLEIKADAPGPLIKRRGFLRDGRPIEITRSAYRGHSHDFVAELMNDVSD